MCRATIRSMTRPWSWPAAAALIRRSRSAIGERAGAIGVLSIEAAARYLKSRDADGLVIGDGFRPRNVEAFLIAVAEDTRFRDLPIGVLGNVPLPDVEFPNISRPRIPHASRPAFCLTVRLHAFEARLRRILHSFDTEGSSIRHRPAFARTPSSAISSAP